MNDTKATPFNNLSGPRITKEEVCWALNNLKNKKAAGPDDVVSEMLKTLDEARIAILYDLISRINESWRSQMIC